MVLQLRAQSLDLITARSGEVPGVELAKLRNWYASESMQGENGTTADADADAGGGNSAGSGACG